MTTTALRFHTTGPDRAPVPADWLAAIEDWSRFMRTAGRPETTIDTRRMHLSRLGRELDGVGPWEATQQQLVDWLASKSWKSETRRSHRTTLRGFYRWAVMFERVHVNPTLNLPAVPVSPGVPRPAQDDQIRFALAGADQRVRLMILLAAMCGLRRGEIAGLHTDDILVHALRVRGKGARVRLVPMPPEVAQALTGFSGARTYIFRSPGTDEPMTAGYVGKLMSAQLPDGVTAHMLRHRFASVCYAAERDLRAVQTLLGHTKPETTAIYTAVPDGALRTAVDAASVLH